jgi:hypothetical protein
MTWQPQSSARALLLEMQYNDAQAKTAKNALIARLFMYLTPPKCSRKGLAAEVSDRVDILIQRS